VLLGCFWCSWGALGVLLVLSKQPGKHIFGGLELSWGALGASCGVLGVLWSALGVAWGALGVLLGYSWGACGALGVLLWFLGVSWVLLGCSCGPPGPKFTREDWVGNQWKSMEITQNPAPNRLKRLLELRL
jgi:hypothetical protein